MGGEGEGGRGGRGWDGRERVVQAGRERVKQDAVKLGGSGCCSSVSTPIFLPRVIRTRWGRGKAGN